MARYYAICAIVVNVPSIGCQPVRAGWVSHHMALSLKGAIVTTESMGCQREIATRIVNAGADDVLAVKENQPTLLERIRQQKVKFRTAQVNCLRGLFAGYGEVMGKNRAALDKAIPGVLARLADRLPSMLIESLREQWNGLENLDQEIAGIERRRQGWLREDKACKAIAAIPGVGLLTATAAVATMGNPKAFRSGREVAAWLGLVPKQTGSGGKVQLLGSSRRGDTYLRTLLIHGARSVLYHAKEPGAWFEQICKRRAANVVIVALARWMARTIWATLAHDQPYEKDMRA